MTLRVLNGHGTAIDDLETAGAVGACFVLWSELQPAAPANLPTKNVLTA